MDAMGSAITSQQQATPAMSHHLPLSHEIVILSDQELLPEMRIDQALKQVLQISH